MLSSFATNHVSFVLECLRCPSVLHNQLHFLECGQRVISRRHTVYHDLLSACDLRYTFDTYAHWQAFTNVFLFFCWDDDE